MKQPGKHERPSGAFRKGALVSGRSNPFGQYMVLGFSVAIATVKGCSTRIRTAKGIRRTECNKAGRAGSTALASQRQRTGCADVASVSRPRTPGRGHACRLWRRNLSGVLVHLKADPTSNCG
jgi:hypothetical protein